MNLAAITRGGDLKLDSYFDESAIKIAKQSRSSVITYGGYEDRHKWVYDAVRTSSWDELIEVIKKECKDIGTILGIFVGQEECRSSGLPIRFIRFMYTESEI